MSVRAGNEPTPGNLAKIYCCNTFYSRKPYNTTINTADNKR